MPQKNKINQLTKEVADKIAAGEVVDRPLSIVKELVENAIDASSSSIMVEIKHGGKEYIRVTDNGCGISKTDLHLAFLRHATSKITTENDLNSISTLGFRGEALASIAAVSRIEIITKTADEKLGSRLKIEGGHIQEEGDTGCPDGTTVIVTDLFYNTPARQKFMKKDATESTLIIDFVSKIALAYPGIRIRLINNGTTLFSTPGKGKVYDNIMTIYSKQIGDNLTHQEHNEGDYSIDAYVSTLSVSRTNRKGQVFFVNGRYVISKVLETAVSEAYKERLADGRYPMAFLFISVNPERIDVNIHPNKREIRFDNNEELQSFVIKAIKGALSSEKALPKIQEKNIFKRETLLTEKLYEDNVNYENSLTNNIDTRKEEQVDINNLLSSKRTPKAVEQREEPTISFDLSQIIITGSIFATYITAYDESNFYLIDQHAAHERIFYEKLLKQLQEEDDNSQVILSPFVINVSSTLKNQSSIWLNQLEKMGYLLEEFGIKSYIVKAVPFFMDMSEAKEFLDEYLVQIGEISTISDGKRIQKVIMNACKSAVKANDMLGPEEMKALIHDLEKVDNPFTCPHGRPTFIKLTKNEIEKMFKRV